MILCKYFDWLGKGSLIGGKIGRFGFCGGNAVKERVETWEEVEEKVNQLAQLVDKAQYPVFFTGAGISTSVGIPDYRSGQDTILKTGPGLWNRPPPSQSQQQSQKPHEPPIDKLVDLAAPSLTHMFIATLINQGTVKHLISQNTDGLHLRSGVPLDKISELHGNRNLEHCLTCLRKYNRDFRTLRRDGKVYGPGQSRDHFTGRHCQNCSGELHDSIIYFGQKLPKSQLVQAYTHAYHSDLLICVGSSLTVKPSSLVPMQIFKKEPQGQLCIVNLQQTALDEHAEVKINYFCDEVFQLLAGKMGVEIDVLTLRHYLRVQLGEDEEGRWLDVEGSDREGNNLTFMREVSMKTAMGKDIISMEGHRCKVPITDPSQVLYLSIAHFGPDNQQCNLTLFPQTLQNRPILIEYSKVPSGQWQATYT